MKSPEEIERTQKQLQKIRDFDEGMYEAIVTFLESVHKYVLGVEIERNLYKQSLEFYANEENWDSLSGNDLWIPNIFLTGNNSRGFRPAKEALAKGAEIADGVVEKWV